MWKAPARCRGAPGQGQAGLAAQHAQHAQHQRSRPSPAPKPLTVIVQQQLGSREQLGPMLWVHDIQLVEVCFPQLFEVLQRLVAVEQQGGRVLLWAEAGHQRGRLQAAPT